MYDKLDKIAIFLRWHCAKCGQHQTTLDGSIFNKIPFQSMKWETLIMLKTNYKEIKLKLSLILFTLVTVASGIFFLLSVMEVW